MTPKKVYFAMIEKTLVQVIKAVQKLEQAALTKGKL